MKMLEDKIHYNRNFNLGLILSLSMTMVLFMAMPHPSIKISESAYYSEPVINLIEIPVTTLEPPAAASLPPALPRIADFVPAVEDPEILGDAVIGSSGPAPAAGINEAGASAEFSSLPFIPRQILEVIPEKVDGADGAIRLRLKIGTDGYVKDYILASNTTGRKECLDKVMTAVKKSRWQPVTIEGDRIEYWIDKTYLFE